MDYRRIITLEPGKRGGKPCIRGLRITVGDVLGWVAAGMSRKEIIDDFPDLTEEDIQACLEFAADRERHTEPSERIEQDEVLREMYAIKDKLSEEAGNDVGAFFRKVRAEEKLSGRKIVSFARERHPGGKIKTVSDAV